MLKVRVKDTKSRYLQALISASDVLISREISLSWYGKQSSQLHLGMWAVPIAVMSSDDAVINNQTSMSELPQHDHRRSSETSLTYAFLVANKLMQLDPVISSTSCDYSGPLTYTAMVAFADGAQALPSPSNGPRHLAGCQW